MENLKPPLPANEWLPIGAHLRPDESVETYRYYQNGLLAEVTVAVNDRPVWAEKHFYFLQKSN